jgi:hypothetical protein
MYWGVGLLVQFSGCIMVTFHTPEALRMFTSTFSSILGAIILISIVLPWFLIGVFAILLLYVYAAAFYRASARELKVPLYIWTVYVDLTRPSSFSSQRLGKAPDCFRIQEAQRVLIPFVRCGVEVFTIFPFLRKSVWNDYYSSIWKIRPVPARQ